METEVRMSTAPWRWSLLLSIVLLNICLPSLVLSYGTLLVYSTSSGLPVWLGVYTPSIFLLTHCLTQCWCRDAADSWGGNVGHRLMASMGLLLVVGSLVACAFLPPAHFSQPLVYGIFGGFGSSLMSAQVDAVIFETYDTRLRLVRALCLIGQAIGQSVFPHIITVSVDYYGYSMSYIIFGAIMLQMLPALMFLKADEPVKRSGSYSRYSDLAKTYAIFNNESSNSFYTNELQLHDLSKNWKSPDNLVEDDEFETYGDEGNNVATITPPPSPEEKRRNIFGVEILPDIPEESEESDDGDKNNTTNKNHNKGKLSNAIKRLSNLGDNFDDYITKQIRRDSQTDSYHSKEYSELDVTYETINPMTEIRREKVFNSFSFRCQSAYASLRRKLWMPSYRVYRLRRRMMNVLYTFNDTFIKPLSRSLSCWRFYPILMLSFSRLIFIAICMVILPLINLKLEPKVSMTDTNFMISLFGFTWISFMLATPWLANMPKRNYKYIVVLGLFVSTAACHIIAAANNHDIYSVGCVVAGLGFAALCSSWESAAQDYVGVHKWSKVHSTLETLSGIGVGAFAVGLTFLVPLEEENGLQFCMMICAYCLAVVLAVWLTIALVSLYLMKSKTFRSRQKSCFF